MRAVRTVKQGQPSIVRLHHAERESEPDPGARTLSLGGKKRIENAIPDLGGHTGAIVGDHDLEVIAFKRRFDL
ncbi:hypothetical protein NKH48_34960, partial [Mesorhizobium sp. M1233]